MQGASSSKDEHLARNPLLFGEPGETGILIGVYHDHNLTSSTVKSEEMRDSLVAVSREFVDVYNRTGRGLGGVGEGGHHPHRPCSVRHSCCTTWGGREVGVVLPVVHPARVLCEPE